MLLLLLYLALWIPSLFGWGSLWAFFRARLHNAKRQTIDVLEPIAGLAALAAVSTLVNFVYPVRGRVAIAALVIGWLLAVLRLRLLGMPRVERSTAVVALLLLVFLAYVGNHPPIQGDAGLYYLQAIEWIKAYRLPLGLANLHGRFGFNTSWFSVAAILELPYYDWRSSVSSYVLPGLLVWHYGLAGLAAVIRLLKGQMTRHSMFLALSLIHLFSGPNPHQMYGQMADQATAILVILSIYVCLRLLDDDIEVTEALGGLLLMALFAVTIKASAAPILLLPAAAWLYARRKRMTVAWRPLGSLAAVIGLVLLAPWVLRGVLLSGCLLYPVWSTCLGGLPWRVEPQAVEREVNGIIRFGRWPGGDRTLVLTTWQWVGPWFERIQGNGNYNTTRRFLQLGLVLLVLTWRRGRWPVVDPALVWLATPILGGLAYWFMTSPDLRFAVGYLWSGALLILSIGLLRLHALRQSHWVMALALILVLGSVYTFIDGRLNNHQTRYSRYWAEQPASRLWLELPRLPREPTQTRETNQGVEITVPTEADRCWLAPLPCTPYFNADLVIDFDAAGRPRMFYIP